jgi:ABC-type branched-subunit amino acid transport system substrate-binding protein
MGTFLAILLGTLGGGLLAKWDNPVLTAAILLTAISQANSTNGETISNIIRNMKYDGALGHVEFDAKGDVKDSPYIVWTARNGKFEEFWTPQRSPSL